MPTPLTAQLIGLDLSGIDGWAADIMTSLGAPGVGVIVALENLFPPIPSEVVLPLAGFLAGQGQLNVVAVIIWATVGSVAGALALYALGAVVDQADRWFARRGGRAVFLGRLIPVIRSFISIPAGVERMPLPRFLAYTTAGSGLWNTLFVLLGYALGSQWEQIGQYSGYLTNAVIALIAGWIVVVIIRRIRSNRSASSAANTPPE